MTYSAGMREDFNNVVSDIGGSVTVYEVITTAASYNKYGDFTVSGTNRYISGVDTVAFFVPRDSTELDIQEFGDREEGDLLGFFKSGLTLGIGYRVSGTFIGDYKVNAINDYNMNGELVYKTCLLDTLDK